MRGRTAKLIGLPLPGSRIGDHLSATADVVTVCMADVEPEHVEFLWPDRVPRGKVILVVGDPGQGKSAFAFDFAARVSSGRPMPLTGVRHPPMSVIVMTAEDGLAHGQFAINRRKSRPVNDYRYHRPKGKRWL